MKTLVRALALGALLATTSLAAANAQGPAPAAVYPLNGTALTLSAFGEVRTAPDMATITIGVQTQGATADAASSANATRMTAMMAALRRAGVTDRDIQTSGLNLSPQYVYGAEQASRLEWLQRQQQSGHRSGRRTWRAWRATPDAAATAGANEVQGVVRAAQPGRRRGRGSPPRGRRPSRPSQPSMPRPPACAWCGCFRSAKAVATSPRRPPFHGDGWAWRE